MQKKAVSDILQVSRDADKITQLETLTDLFLCFWHQCFIPLGLFLPLVCVWGIVFQQFAQKSGHNWDDLVGNARENVLHLLIPELEQLKSLPLRC